MWERAAFSHPLREEAQIRQDITSIFSLECIKWGLPLKLDELHDAVLSTLGKQKLAEAACELKNWQSF